MYFIDCLKKEYSLNYVFSKSVIQHPTQSQAGEFRMMPPSEEKWKGRKARFWLWPLNSGLDLV